MNLLRIRIGMLGGVFYAIKNTTKHIIKEIKKNIKKGKLKIHYYIDNF